MLITCNGCNSKIRVPDSATGRRVKCPKCATLIRVPGGEGSPESANPKATGVSSTPLPPPPPAESESEPQESADPDAFSTTPSSSGSKPPPIKKKRASSVDDDDDDDERTPPSKRRRKYDDDEDEDDEDDELDVRNRRSRSRPKGVNGLAMTSMIMGIVSVVTVFGSCCCGLFWIIALICSIMAIIFGLLGKSPGSESYAWTGIICGSVTIGLLVIGFVIAFFFIGLDVALNQGRILR